MRVSILTSIACASATAALLLLSAAPANATYDPCDSAQSLNEQGGNFDTFVTDEGVAKTNDCAVQPGEPEFASPTEPEKVIVEEAATPEVQVPVVEDPIIVETPAIQEVETTQVEEPAENPKKKKKKKDKKQKDPKPGNVIVNPSASVVTEETTDGTDEVPFTAVVVAEEPAPIGEVQAAAIPVESELPWLHIYGISAVLLALLALFVASRRKSTNN